MRAADWYFDFLSPFSYLQLVQFDRLPADLEVTYRPVLFAGLLGHWGHKGPAEIPAKRVHTYRWCHWYAARHGIPFRMPPAHPFNPLRPLRLAVAQGAEPALVRAVFDAIWAEGRDPSRDDEWQALTERLAIADADEAIARPEIKEALKRNTQEAAERGGLRRAHLRRRRRAVLGLRCHRSGAGLPERSCAAGDGRIRPHRQPAHRAGAQALVGHASSEQGDEDERAPEHDQAVDGRGARR